MTRGLKLGVAKACGAGGNLFTHNEVVGTVHAAVAVHNQGGVLLIGFDGFHQSPNPAAAAGCLLGA